MSFLRRLHLLGCVFACILFAPALQAATVHLSGTTVDFYYNDAQPGMAAYGMLTAVGDSIFAQPTSFFAEAVDGGNDSFAVLGTVTVVAKAGYSFDLVQMAQQGDYIRAGSGAVVTVSTDLEVTDTFDMATTINSVLTSSSDFTLLGTNSWSSQTTVDLSGAMWNGVSSIELTLDTLLTADTMASGEHAKIQNKLTGGGLVTVMTVVPLPASIWLFLAGLGILLRGGRRKSLDS